MPLFGSTSSTYGGTKDHNPYHQEDRVSLCSFQNATSEVHYQFQPSKQIVSACGWVLYLNLFHIHFHHHQQTYATLGRTSHSNMTRVSPVTTTPVPLAVSAVSPSQALVTRATFSDYRFGPEIITTSNRIQESCI